MAFQERKKFTFVSKALPEDTFNVVRFKGVEGISRLYEFEIMLVSDDPEINLKEVLQNPATLTISSEDQDRPIHGILSQFEQLHEVKQYVFYRAVLVPKLWQADLYHENQLFLDKTVPDIIEEILKQAGLTTLDYELKLTRSYPQWEYICQYRETDFNFISRWMEREGIYYYFEQTDQGEKLIITDSSTAHNDISGEKTIYYSPPSALIPEEKEVVKAFICRQKMLPKKVILKDYNYRKPSLDLKGAAEVDSKGRGEVYIYGEHFKEPEQGNELAKTRAEEVLCREKVFHGESTTPGLCSGFYFELAYHYRDSYNQKYLITEVDHEGSQAGIFLTGLEEELTEKEKELAYSNQFTVIPADVQFRPERKTPKPRFNGTMNALVDAAGDGKYAEIDDQGRYKVKLPFDLSGNKKGKASRYIRMAQPYSGAGFGMHFPLHKGAEVLLTFVDGDPDRPIISGSVPNPETASPVTGGNQSQCVIRTGGNNIIEMEDTGGGERIKMSSPNSESVFSIGAARNPSAGISGTTLGDMTWRAAGNLFTRIELDEDRTIRGSKKELVIGEEELTVHGDKKVLVKGNSINDVQGSYQQTIVGNRLARRLANDIEIIVGAKTTNVFGFKTDLVQGVKTDIHYGWKFGRSETGEIKKLPTKKHKLEIADEKIKILRRYISSTTNTINKQMSDIKTRVEEVAKETQKIDELEQNIKNLTQDINEWKTKVKGAFKMTAGVITQNAKACKLMMGDVAELKKGGKKITITSKVSINVTALIIK